MKFPSYPKYKDSGVEWLGEVPEHWEVKRGRFCMQVNPRTDKLRALGPDDEVSFVPMDAVGEYGGLRLDTTKPLADIGTGYTEFQNGDVIVAKITPCFENWKGALATNLFNGVAMGTTELHVLRALQYLDAQFLFYLTLSNGYRKTGEAEMYGAGGQKRVPPEFNKNFCTPLPPLLEQHAIAAFLDAQTSKIDTLIAKKRELIDKLKEKRAALITRTVTRGLPPEAAKAAGLDPNPKMKDSGVEWLGEVPEHWGVKRLKHLATLQSGITLGKDRKHKNTISVPYLRVANVQDGYIDITDVAEIDIEPHELEKYALRKGDVLMNEGGDNDKLGRGAVWSGDVNPCIHQNHVFCIRPHHVEPEYISLFTQSLCAKSYFFMSAKQSTNLASISSRSIIELHIPVPPKSERRIVLDYVAKQCAQIDKAISLAEAAAIKLLELRSALITAAVTGKIDIREATQ